MANSMPLFSRLIASWSAFVLIFGACVLQNGIIQVVHSDLTVGYNIEIGNLTSEAEQAISAVAKLSNGANQQGWWKLAKVGWHDSAIQRFFAQGPLRAAEMEKLAKVSGQPNSWVKSEVVSVTRQTDLMLALQKLSTATYRLNKTIQGTGRIEASMWTLLFRCIGIRSCNEGYFVPMIFVVSSGDNRQPDDHNYQYSYRTVWLRLTNTLIVNAIPSFNAKLPSATPVTMKNIDDPELSVVVNVYDSITECPSTAEAILGYRSLLDASYGLVPGLACINFGKAHDPPLKLLVSLVIFFNNATEPRGVSLTTLEEFFSAVQVKTGEKHLLFEECSEEGVLINSSQDPKSLKLCYQKVCVTSYVGNGTCSADGAQHLRFLQSISTLSKKCTYDGGKPLHSSNFTAPTEVSCQMSSANEMCNATVEVVNVESAYSVDPLRLLSPQSNWISTEGNNTSEFSQAPNMTDFNATRMCIRTPPPISPFFVSNTTQAAFLQAIQIQARAYLKSFIAQHNIAFMAIKGPATDFQSFLALIVSTAISVILAIAGPFPNFLLRRICRIRPLHLDSQRSRVSKVVNVSFQMICNMLLSFCSFLPVMYMAWSELDRESPFYTWDLGSNDQFIYNSFKSDTQLRVVYLLSGTSQYRSNFIIASTLVVCITCFIAGACSAWRSKQVFDRYALLQKCASIVGPLDSEERALKAIEMTEAEYRVLKRKYQQLIEQMFFRRRLIAGRHTHNHSHRESPASNFLVDYTPSHSVAGNASMWPQFREFHTEGRFYSYEFY